MLSNILSSVMVPGIALLILSTTMRLGNVRAALTELIKALPSDLESLKSYQLLSTRVSYLCKGLRLLNLSLLTLIGSLIIDLLATQTIVAVQASVGVKGLVFSINSISLLLLFYGVIQLFLESKITGKSVISLSIDMLNLSKNKQI